MATTDLSNYDPSEVPSAEGFSFGIVVAEWNPEVTEALAKGAYDTLVKHGVDPDDIIKQYVPGTFELTFGSKIMAMNTDVDAVIAIGCVIQGETRHFDFICQGVTQGITTLNIEYDIPFVFCVLTTENQQQALDRAGGVHGNKGVEAAITAIKMATLEERIWEHYNDDFMDDDDDDDFLEGEDEEELIF